MSIENQNEFILVCKHCGVHVAHSTQVDVVKNIYERNGMMFFRRIKDTMTIQIDQVCNTRFSKQIELIKAINEPSDLDCIEEEVS